MQVLLVGDSHGNRRWWETVVKPTAARLGVDAICQLGDFGLWRGAQSFLDAVAASDVPVMFLDGNHEDHEWLHTFVAAASDGSNQPSPVVPIPISGQLSYLPRGVRLVWGGVDVVVLGGARSIDRRLRTPGVDWFAAEAITDADLERVVSGGSATVMLCHDAPLSAPVPLMSDVFLPEVWRSELEPCRGHRQRVDAAMDAVRPSLLVHGHYHVRWDGVVHRPWGTCQVVGLDCDGADRDDDSLLVLDCVDGRFDIRPVNDATRAR